MKTETEEKYILLSIQPHFANKIFEGTKRVELRRSFAKSYDNESIVIVYVSTPVKAIVGGFQISHVVKENPTVLWRKVKDIAGVTFEEFNNYYSGVEDGYGIFINKVWKYSTPISLELLRNSFINFSPPQNFRYLCKAKASNLNLNYSENSDYISHEF